MELPDAKELYKKSLEYHDRKYKEYQDKIIRELNEQKHLLIEGKPVTIRLPSDEILNDFMESSLQRWLLKYGYYLYAYSDRRLLEITLKEFSPPIFTK